MKESFLKHRLENMTLSEKIGQIIMIDYSDILEMNTELEKILTKYKPGGFIVFKSNISNYEQTRKFLLDVKFSIDIPIMMSVDQEGGSVQRLDENVGFEKYPSMYEVGKTLDKNIALEIGKKMGRELKNIGIDMNMAPVLDIFSNSRNKAIANRTFGSDSSTVNKMAFAFSDGLLSESVIPVGKHFPGHGSTIEDSHIDLPIINKDLNELKELELTPFIEAVNKQLPAIMVGHIAVPPITQNHTPASLSKVMVTNLLRNDMGYNGLIVSDSLKMKALSNYYTNAEIYFKSIEAGNDLLLMPNDIEEAYNVIYENINNGTIPIERINTSVYRILSVKFDYGLFDKEYSQFSNKKNRYKDEDKGEKINEKRSNICNL